MSSAVRKSPGHPPDAWEPPESFDEYRLVRPLGRGAAGRVYLAHDTLLDRAVAVKFIPALDEGVLSRFLVEARAAARLQHPNVVTLYRVGQLDNRPYLVSEYVRGTSLDKVERPLAPERVRELALQLARGLGAAHRRGVLHRDVKPGNVLLAESGEVKLLDFGLAKITDPGAAVTPADPGAATPQADVLDGHSLPSVGGGGLVGTPAYMSPEAWAGAELTARSDLYSLGVVLHELLAGRTPFRHVATVELPVAVQEEDARPLVEAAPQVPAALAAVVDRLLRRDPAERFPSTEAVLDALEASAPQAPLAELPEGNPYRGLQAFEAEHRALFFGRRRDLRAALERLRGEPFLAVTGDSGVGKSSLCLAGVLPALADGALEDGRVWRSARLVPGRRPLAALARALADALGLSEEALERDVRAEPAALGRALRQRLGREGGLALYVDQLEELVTLSAPEDAALFGLALAPLAEGLGGVRLLASTRSDFLTRLTAVPGLGPELPRALFLLRAMGPEEIREAVVGPARVKGVRFESDALVETLVRSAAGTDGGLPLLQFALAELWEARDGAQGDITAAALERLGGVAGALARHADAVVERLVPDQRAAARAVLRRLVTAEGTRSRKTAEEVGGEDPRYRVALEALVRGRLLVARESGGEAAYELAHETLITGWDALARWVAEGGELRALQARLEADAAHWDRAGRPRGLGWRARQLAEAARLTEDELPAREVAFLAASRRAVRQTRTARWALLLLVVLGVPTTLGAIRLDAVLRREREVDAALADARARGAEAATAERALEEARRQALALFDAGRSQEAEAHWAGVVAQEAALGQLRSEAGAALELAVSLAPDEPRVRAAFAEFLLQRAEDADADGRAAVRDEALRRLRLYDDGGERRARFDRPATLRVELEPAGARVTLEPLSRTAGAGPSRPLIGTEASLPAGTWRVRAWAPGRAEVIDVVTLVRGEKRMLPLRLPPAARVPTPFVYVPAGTFLAGSADPFGIREFFNAAPLHSLRTDAFLIARHETTYADWIAYLEALPPAERARRTPHVGMALHGVLDLRKDRGGWSLRLKPGGVVYQARAGERLRYAARNLRAEQDWLRFPVTGISFEDAVAYASWLAKSGRVPGARLCTEIEWERAARGSDGRFFPHGDTLAPDDANYDLTYGKQRDAFGPDEVGSHPRSRSPFGVDDLAGNVWEWTRSARDGALPVARGGSFYYNANSSRSANRELPEATLRDLTVGLRLCADPS